MPVQAPCLRIPLQAGAQNGRVSQSSGWCCSVVRMAQRLLLLFVVLASAAALRLCCCQGAVLCAIRPCLRLPICAPSASMPQCAKLDADSSHIICRVMPSTCCTSHCSAALGCSSRWRVNERVACRLPAGQNHRSAPCGLHLRGPAEELALLQRHSGCACDHDTQTKVLGAMLLRQAGNASTHIEQCARRRPVAGACCCCASLGSDVKRPWPRLQ